MIQSYAAAVSATQTHADAHAHAHVRAHTYTHAHTCTHTCTHTRTHVHTRTPPYNCTRDVICGAMTEDGQGRASTLETGASFLTFGPERGHAAPHGAPRGGTRFGPGGRSRSRGSSGLQNWVLYWVFRRKGKAGQGDRLRTGRRPHSGSLWAVKVVASGLVSAPGAALAWHVGIR